MSDRFQSFASGIYVFCQKDTRVCELIMARTSGSRSVRQRERERERDRERERKRERERESGKEDHV